MWPLISKREFIRLNCGLSDRALIGVMVYSFARVSAAQARGIPPSPGGTVFPRTRGPLPDVGKWQDARHPLQ